jgi:hypothetical protein
MSTNTFALPRRSFYKDESNSGFLQKAIWSSAIIHVAVFMLQFPSESIKAPIREKLGAIKMSMITPPESYRLKKKDIFSKEVVKKTLSDLTQGAQVVSQSKNSNSGDPTQNKVQREQKSKAGSAKNGKASAPGTSSGGLGDSATAGYQFKGKGLNALVGNSSTMTIASGGNKDGSRGLIGGSGVSNKGNNLSGDYRAPNSTGDGSGHLLGKDLAGNYDRSISTKGLSNKKGFDTSYVQPQTVVLGSIDPEILRKILGEYLSQFKFCYQQELQENSDKIKGIIDLNFRIEADGKVTKVNIKSSQTIFSTKGIGCMTNILKMIEFPKPKGGGLVDVRQPLNFSAESTKI